MSPAGSEPDVLVLPDVAAWRAWLDEHEGTSDGVWLLLAKKGVTEPTSLSYLQALEEALCSGWIDGQSKRVDDRTFRQRFTPRRARSIWSARNVDRVGELLAQGRMRPRGLAEVDRARADGRWDNAYQGPATIEVPPDLAAALAADARAAETFAGLDARNRYALLHRVVTAQRPQTRERRVAVAVERLARGEVPYPG